MFLLKLLVISFAGFVSARPGGFHTSFQKSAYFNIAAPAISLASAPTVSYSDPVTPKATVLSAAPVSSISAAPVSSSITTRVQYDPHAFGRKAQRIVGVISDIARSVGNFVSESIRDFTPTKITTTVNQTPVIKTVQHSASVVKTFHSSAPVIKTVSKEVY